MTSMPPFVHRPDGDLGPQVSSPAALNSQERVPSWPLRRRIHSRDRNPIPSLQIGHSQLLASPTYTTETHRGKQFGYDALKQGLVTIVNEVLHESPPCSSNAFLVTDKPSWLDELKRDMEIMFRKELSEQLSHFSKALVVTEEPSWVEALRQDLQSVLRNDFFEQTWEFTRHSKLQLHGADAVATPIRENRFSGVPEEIAAHECPGPENHQSRRVCIQAPATAVDRASNQWTPKSSERGHDEAILADLRGQIFRTSKAPRRCTSADAIKENFHRTKQKPYDVSDMYNENGFFQAVARHKMFGQCSIAVIILNSIWMAVDSDLNGKQSLLDSKLVFVLADIVFYTYFGGELLIRFLAFKRKADCCKDGWFVFDSLAVLIYTLDPFVICFLETATGGMGSGSGLESWRLLRLGRLSRLPRMLRHVPEMLIMIKGMVTALATVGYALGLLTLLTYVFAVALRKAVPKGSELETQYFPTVLETMHYLLIHGTFLDDLSGFIMAVKSQSVVCLILSWLFTILSALLVMNMLTGVLCQVISTVAIEEQERVSSEQISEKFYTLLGKFDANEDGVLEWEEFARLLESEATQHALKQSDVDVDALVDMVEDMFFYSYGGTNDDSDDKITIAYAQVIELILQLRGSQPASVKDVMAIGKRFNLKLHELKACFSTNHLPIHTRIQD